MKVFWPSRPCQPMVVPNDVGGVIMPVERPDVEADGFNRFCAAQSASSQ